MKIEMDQIRKQWGRRGFSCDLWTDPPGQVWEGYRHEVDELFMAVEGQVEFEMNRSKCLLKPGEEIFIPAGVVHSVRNLGRSQSRWLYGYRREQD